MWSPDPFGKKVLKICSRGSWRLSNESCGDDVVVVVVVVVVVSIIILRVVLVVVVGVVALRVELRTRDVTSAS